MKQEDEITRIINRVVPEGKDILLHVDRREAVDKIIRNVLDRGVMEYDLINITAICMSWRDLLHTHLKTLN